jgi:hypothetical protein
MSNTAKKGGFCDKKRSRSQRCQDRQLERGQQHRIIVQTPRVTWRSAYYIK